MLRREFWSQLSLNELAPSRAPVLLDTWPLEQREVRELKSPEPPDVVPLWWWSLLRKELPPESQCVPQELRHEREELKLEPSSRVELLSLRRSLEPLREDVEERQHQPQPQELEECLDPLCRPLDEP